MPAGITVTDAGWASAASRTVPSGRSEVTKVDVPGSRGAMPAAYVMVSCCPAARATPVTVMSRPDADIAPSLELT